MSGNLNADQKNELLNRVRGVHGVIRLGCRASAAKFGVLGVADEAETTVR